MGGRGHPSSSFIPASVSLSLALLLSLRPPLPFSAFYTDLACCRLSPPSLCSLPAPPSPPQSSCPPRQGLDESGGEVSSSLLALAAHPFEGLPAPCQQEGSLFIVQLRTIRARSSYPRSLTRSHSRRVVQAKGIWYKSSSLGWSSQSGAPVVG